jgi:hypothetical protein
MRNPDAILTKWQAGMISAARLPASAFPAPTKPMSMLPPNVPWLAFRATEALPILRHMLHASLHASTRSFSPPLVRPQPLELIAVRLVPLPPPRLLEEAQAAATRVCRSSSCALVDSRCADSFQEPPKTQPAPPHPRLPLLNLLPRPVLLVAFRWAFPLPASLVS